MTRRQVYLWLAFAILAGGLVRGYLAWTASVISRDGVAYLTIARAAADDWREGIRADHQAGLPLLIRTVEPLVRPWAPAEEVFRWQRAGQAVSLMGGIACIPLVYMLGRRLCTRRTALLAAWIWALLPYACRFSADVLTDMPALALTLTGLILTMDALHKRSLGRLFAAGLLIGAAYAIRVETAAVVATAVILAPLVRSATFRWRLASPAVVVIGFLVIGGPFIWLEDGEVFSEKPGVFRIDWLPPSPAFSSARESADDAAPAAISATASPAAFLVTRFTAPPLAQIAVAEHAAELGRSLLYLLSKLFDSLNGVWFVLGAIYLFLPGRWRRLHWDRLSAPLVLWAIHAAACLWVEMKFGYLSRRHVMLLNVGVVLMAAGTLACLADIWTYRTRLVKSRWHAVARRSDAIVLALVVAALSPRILRDINDDRLYIHEAAQWVRGHYEDPPRIYAQYGWVPYYAGARDWVEHRDPARFGADPEFARADLAIVDLHGADPERIVSRAPTHVRLSEAARFTGPKRRRGVVIYHIRADESPAGTTCTDISTALHSSPSPPPVSTD